MDSLTHNLKVPIALINIFIYGISSSQVDFLLTFSVNT